MATSHAKMTSCSRRRRRLIALVVEPPLTNDVASSGDDRGGVLAVMALAPLAASAKNLAAGCNLFHC